MKHVVFAIGTLHGGGAERVVSVWASALVQKGYRVTAVLYTRMEAEYAISPKVEIRTIAESAEECEQFSMIQRLRRFRAEIKALKPDVIISFLPVIQVYIALASFGLHIPRVETVRNNPWREPILKTRFSRLWRWCFKSCDAVILQSEDQKPFFKKSVQKKSVVIPNPINPVYLENRKDEYRENASEIVAAGRLTAQKNYKMMIDAIEIVSKDRQDVSLRIYGKGPLEEQLRSYVAEKGLQKNISFMGRSNELYKVYRDADLYVMSSDYEGMPNALAEAMAAGLPCISTDCKTGPRDLIDDGETGYLVSCDDAVGLAEKIKKVMLMSSDERRTMGRKASDKIAGFCGEENSLSRLIKLIDSL